MKTACPLILSVSEWPSAFDRRCSRRSVLSPISHPGVSRPHSAHCRYNRDAVQRKRSSCPRIKHFTLNPCICPVPWSRVSFDLSYPFCHELQALGYGPEDSSTWSGITTSIWTLPSP